MLFKILDLFRTFTEWRSFRKLDCNESLVVYSEGSHDWPHMGPMIKKFLLLSKRKVIYVSSEFTDPGLTFKDRNYSSFYIGSGIIRIIFFQLLKCRVLLLTLTDLNNFHVKKSIVCNVHYVYCFHSINSIHAAYRENSFDHYDTIFCVGPHHIQEFEVDDKIKKIKNRKLIAHGSIRLDELMKENKRIKIHAHSFPEVILAPSWGKGSFLEDENLIKKILKTLIDNNFKCLLRCHAMTVRNKSNILNRLKIDFKEHLGDRFIVETNLSTNESLRSANIMISDWSGASMEFAFAFLKPVIFINTEQKINNLNWKKYDLPCFEEKIREKIGKIVNVNQIDTLPKLIKDLIQNSTNLEKEISYFHEKNIFNKGKSSEVGAEYIINILNKN